MDCNDDVDVFFPSEDAEVGQEAAAAAGLGTVRSTLPAIDSVVLFFISSMDFLSEQVPLLKLYAKQLLSLQQELIQLDSEASFMVW